MATRKKEKVTLDQAAGEPKGYPYELLGRKFYYQEPTVGLMRSLRKVAGSGGRDLDGTLKVIDAVCDILTDPQLVNVVEGEPFTETDLNRLGMSEFAPLMNFFINPATAQEAEADPKAA